jgi:uncharacterized protein (TIGR00255 family)
MIRSMTAFARSERQGDWGTITWELRSVNHRYLDVFFRLPDEFRALEAQCRERVQQRLGRGKVECSLRYQPSGVVPGELDLDEAAAGAVVVACERIEKLMNNPARLTAIEVLRWPGVVREQRPELEALRAEALSLLDAALAELRATREREGERLREVLEQRCAGITEIVARVRERRPQVMQGLREKLMARIESLDVTPDPGRLEQELAIVAQRLDVDEELDRLDTHLAEVVDVLKRKEPVGRRLDFLMQEFNREANTLGSKANDVETTQAAVDLKVLIEQMREQVQNIE